MLKRNFHQLWDAAGRSVTITHIVEANLSQISNINWRELSWHHTTKNWSCDRDKREIVL
jgi:hypothetical protein